MEFKNKLRSSKWIEVILPLAIGGTYTYSVPIEYLDIIKVGVRVEVPLRNKHYAAIVDNIIDVDPQVPVKPIISQIDEEPIVTPEQRKLWHWIAKYYCCTIGEVMIVALPSALKLTSETKIMLNPYRQVSPSPKKQREFLMVESLSHQEEMTIGALRKLINKKNVYGFLRDQINKQHVFVKEELINKYKPKFEDFIKLKEEWFCKSDEAFGLVKRSEKQLDTLTRIVELHEEFIWIPKSILYKSSPANAGVIKAMQKKHLIIVERHQIDRIKVKEDPDTVHQELSEAQQIAADSIDASFQNNPVVLLHGVTGSGKTQIFIDKIQKVIDAGGQVLYLLPEIALTSQMLSRMEQVFGKSVLFYHSRMNSAEQVEVWQKVMDGHSIVLGARSSIFLPFTRLSLIIVDEEHDTSYKQQDPAPRYNARDLAVFLAHAFGAKVLLGTATPSLESLQNKLDKKYGYVALKERFGNAKLPAIRIVDISPEDKKKPKEVLFSEELIHAISKRITANEQVLLFQNRRGFAPMLRCFKCGWHMECPNCDVSLTTHKYSKEMRCHYCGYRSGEIKVCPSCHNRDIKLIGFGTEKVETELQVHFPEISIKRMDHDTMRGKDSFSKVIADMQMGNIDVLVGTQMVTKGLDFDKITLVGILHADALFGFPDFRAGEKAFQLLTQVSGRAGRKVEHSEVIIQTYDPENWIIEKVINYDFSSFASSELGERKLFKYPPFYRMIELTIKHKRRPTARESAHLLAHILRKKLGKRILGPAEPNVARINNVYHMNILIKMGKLPKQIQGIKQFMQIAIKEVRSKEGFSGVRININVDPL